jgi:hypothetical protein
MWNAIFLLIRILALLSGLLMFYVAFFLYEDEQGNVQNKLEDSWIKLNDLRRLALSRHTAFMRVIANFTASILDKIYGKTFFSIRFVGVSTCLSFVSIFLVKMWHKHGIVYYNSLYILVLIIIYLILASIPMFISNQESIKAWFFLVITLTPFTIVALHIFIWNPNVSIKNISILSEVDLISELLPSFLVGAAIAVACDILFISLTRLILRWCAELTSFFKIIAILFLNSILVVSLFLVPIYYQGAFDIYIFDLFSSENKQRIWFGPYVTLTFIYEVTFYSNLYTSFIATLFILLAIIMLLHKLLWPGIERSVYALQEIGIARRKKLFAALGIVLIAVWLGHTSEFLKVFEKLTP